MVIATHGWIEKSKWPADLALAFQGKSDPNQWVCAWLDWRAQSQTINPTDAARYARYTAGPMLGRRIVELSRHWKHVHLIGHSAGSWVISEAARIVAAETDAEIHLTFLDAYVPPFWKQHELGGPWEDPNIVYWADHYFTRDVTLGPTQAILARAHNVDLTRIDPGVNSHKFPWHWYCATLAGKYVTADRYRDKQLFLRSDDLDYGFARTLAAGIDNWRRSRLLRTGDPAVSITPE